MKMRMAAIFADQTPAIRKMIRHSIRVTEKMKMQKAKERAKDVPLAADAPQGVVAQALPRAKARALVPRPRSGRLGSLMQEKSRKGGSPNASKSNRRNLP